MTIDGDCISSHSPTFKNPAQYLKAKLNILQDERSFNIKPTDEEMAHLKTLKTQTSIDNAIRSIIWRRWDT